MESAFRQRIGFIGDLKELSKSISRDFSLGDFLEGKIILIGHEDFNLSLETTKGKFFVKIFSKERPFGDCKRIVDVMIKSLEAGVSVPKLYPSEQGYLNLLKIDQLTLRICVMDYIGKDFFASKEEITHEDMLFLACQAALINSMDFKPSKIYDSWAITNFLAEFEKKIQYLDKEDSDMITPLVEKFKKLKVETLPHCFTHGDIIRTNVIKDKNNKIWIIDFSVSNYYPRIQELAVLACDILFDKDSKERSRQNLKDALEEYQKKIKLTPREIESLPTYIKIAHAMHVLCATYEKKVRNNISEEDQRFLNIGKSGLRQWDSPYL
jgi:thiamine kinase-like enzyme